MYQVITYWQEDQSAMHKFKTEVSKLWSEHGWYTRNYVVSGLAKLEDTTALNARLLKNQEDIGATLSPYYGEDRAMEFVELLKAHIVKAAEIVGLAANAQSTMAANAEWMKNGDAIVAWMETVNPVDWAKGIVQPIWNNHMKLVGDQITARVAKEWIADIKACDDNYTTILNMSDVFARGIIHQNMNNFSYR